MDTLIDVEASGRLFAADDWPTYRDLQIWKTTQDLYRYGMAVTAADPQVLIETGTHTGGFAAYAADVFDLKVITIDHAPRRSRPQRWAGVTFLVGDSTSPHILATVKELLPPGGRVMVTLDSDHHAPHVEAEIAAYGPLVTPGCHLIVEDGLADLLPPEAARAFGARIPETGGPLAAIRRTIANDPQWRRATVIETHTPVTTSPGGWWLRRQP